MTMIILLVLLVLDIGFLVYSLTTGSYQKKKRYVTRIVLFLLLVILALTGIIKWGFQWYGLYVIGFISAVTGLLHLLRRKEQKEKIFKRRHVIMTAVGSLLLAVFAVFPAVLFPQYAPVKPTGDYEIKTVSYTITDPERKESFSDTDENRKVTIQFWYPDNDNAQYPLLVFSHGAFGFRGSNTSTFTDLASNGYVVCSIDHTYHSFFTKQADGTTVIADMKFVNDAMGAQQNAFDARTTYEMTKDWMKLRLGDFNLVLDDIENKIEANDPDEVYQRIDPEEIGVFGHSLGGAASAQIGRDRTDIDAVIVVDGTMLGEKIGFGDEGVILNTAPYQVPLLNIYAEDHYEDAVKEADQYANMVAAANADDARQVVIRGAGHLNFTDLPLFSPALASLLGTGDVDSRACIETTNKIILDYFDHYLKNTGELELKPEYEP